MSETKGTAEVPAEAARAEVLPPSAAEQQMVVLSQPAADLAVQELKAAPQRSVVTCSSPALRRYQHYAATLGRELALLLLCQGSSALTAVARVTFRLVRVLGLRLHHWLANNELPRAAVAVLARAFRSLRLALQQHVAQPLGRLLTQLVWIQIQLSTDEVPEEGTRLSARLNSCVSLLFGSIRLRSHSCLQLARPSRQPPLAPEFSLTSPAPSPRRLHRATRHHHHQQQQQQRGQLARSASTPMPNTSPRGTGRAAGQAAAAAPFSSSSRRRVFAGSSPRNSSSSINPQAWQDPQHAAAAERASLARALRFSQHPGVQGLGASAGADSEVHVLCSSELKMAIMSFLQAHSRRNGSEFVLLRNFATSAPPTPTAGTPPPETDTAAAAAAAAAAGGASAATAAQEQHQQQLEVVLTPAAAAAAAAGAQDAAEAVGFGPEGLPGCASKARMQQQTAQIFAVAAGSSGGGSLWLTNDSHNQQQEQQQQSFLQAAACLPVGLPAGHGNQPSQHLDMDLQQQQQGEEDSEEGHGSGWGTPTGPVTLADAWEQLSQQQQQQPGDALLAHGPGSNGSSSSTSRVLADAASILAAAADALGDNQALDSPRKCDPSPKKSATAAARAAIAAAAAQTVASSSATTATSRSFVSAADKFRSLAASAAASEADTDLCSKPLMAFSRRYGGSSPPVGSRRNSAQREREADTGSSLHQQEQYARLFPPGSRSFEALSLRKSGGKSPIGTPACHARNTVTFVKKKLPAAPFALSSSLPLPGLDGSAEHESH